MPYPVGVEGPSSRIPCPLGVAAASDPPSGRSLTPHSEPSLHVFPRSFRVPYIVHSLLETRFEAVSNRELVFTPLIEFSLYRGEKLPTSPPTTGESLFRKFLTGDPFGASRGDHAFSPMSRLVDEDVSE